MEAESTEGDPAWLHLQPRASSLGQATSALSLLAQIPGQPSPLPETPRRAPAVRHSLASLSLEKV